jgi:hypothetical protein
MNNLGVQHWRDGELIETIYSSDVFISIQGGILHIIMPEGLVELATEDELHINLEDLKEFLDELDYAYTGRKKS